MLTTVCIVLALQKKSYARPTHTYARPTHTKGRPFHYSRCTWPANNIVSHSKVHAPNASSNAASSGKGILGTAPPGSGMQGDGHLKTDVAMPLSHHRKPSAPLYGTTKKPSVHASGDGHALRKPAVHIGILHAASDSIRVRCTWANRNVSREVYQPPAPPQSQHPVYRPPTPPETSSHCEGDMRQKIGLQQKLKRMSLHSPLEKTVFLCHFCIDVDTGMKSLNPIPSPFPMQLSPAPHAFPHPSPSPSLQLSLSPSRAHCYFHIKESLRHSTPCNMLIVISIN